MSQRRRRSVLSTSGILILSLVVALGFILQLPLPTLAAQPVAPLQPTASTVHMPWPAYGEAAIGAVNYGVLASHGSETPMPTASTAKMMTALAILKKHPLSVGQAGPMLTLTQADVDYYNTYFAEDGSIAKVAVGEQISEYQALEAMLLPSANNMAETLAVWGFGSQPAYVSYANSYAPTLGMNHTHFADASGFSPLTVSTPSDLVKLGEASLQNPVLAQIVSQKTAVVPVAGLINNVNWDLGYDGINGIKTGSTDQDGGAFMFSAAKRYANGQQLTVVGVIMGAKLLAQTMHDAPPLLLAAEQNFKPSTIVTAGQIVGHYSVPWGRTIDAIAIQPLTLLAWQGGKTPIAINLKPLTPLSDKGTITGSISSTILPGTLIPVSTSQAITPPSWVWRTVGRFLPNANV